MLLLCLNPLKFFVVSFQYSPHSRSNSRDKLRDRVDAPLKVLPKRDPLTPGNSIHPMMSSREMIISLMLKERQDDYTSLNNYRLSMIVLMMIMVTRYHMVIIIIVVVVVVVMTQYHIYLL